MAFLQTKPPLCGSWWSAQIAPQIVGSLLPWAWIGAIWNAGLVPHTTAPAVLPHRMRPNQRRWRNNWGRALTCCSFHSLILCLALNTRFTRPRRATVVIHRFVFLGSSSLGLPTRLGLALPRLSGLFGFAFPCHSFQSKQGQSCLVFLLNLFQHQLVVQSLCGNNVELIQTSYRSNLKQKNFPALSFLCQGQAKFLAPMTCRWPSLALWQANTKSRPGSS